VSDEFSDGEKLGESEVAELEHDEWAVIGLCQAVQIPHQVFWSRCEAYDVPNIHGLGYKMNACSSWFLFLAEDVRAVGERPNKIVSVPVKVWV
jgi:hypothetical protein